MSRFLSTPSGWRATVFGHIRAPGLSNFYPRPPGGGRRHIVLVDGFGKLFLSTPSGWRATCKLQAFLNKMIISIHALRVEGDQFDYPVYIDLEISIHALRVEGDWRVRSSTTRRLLFLSTPSGWRATVTISAKTSPIRPDFYPRPPGGGRLETVSFWSRAITDFYPRPPGGGRQQKRTKFSSAFAQKGEEFASLRRGKRKICRWRFKKDKFWVLIWCEGSGKSVCASASHCG